MTGCLIGNCMPLDGWLLHRGLTDLSVYHVLAVLRFSLSLFVHCTRHTTICTRLSLKHKEFCVNVHFSNGNGV